jgi:hypothetical protein
MASMVKLTRQGVRDLNDLGGKRINGKRNSCPHFPDDIVVSGQITRSDGNEAWAVNVLSCSACEQVLGAEDEFEAS